MRKSQSLRILHVLDKSGFGGIQTTASRLMTEKFLPHKVYFLFLRNINSESNIKDVHSANVFYGRHGSKYNPLSFVDMLRIVRKYNIDILHCHQPKGLAYSLLIKLFFNKNLIILYHEHGDIFENNPLYEFLLKLSRPHVTRFISVSEETSRRLVQHANIDRVNIFLLHNAVNSQRVANLQERRGNRAHIGAGPADFLVGFAARLIERKGWECYLDAAKIISDKYGHVRFIIAGDGPDKPKILAKIQELGLSEKVVFMGYVSDMERFYNIIDCFVVPSHWEPFGNVVLEAMSRRVPVIASDIHGIDEIVANGKNGLLFTCNDSNELSQKIRSLMNKQLSSRLVNNSISTVALHSSKNYRKKLKELYSISSNGQ